MPAKIFKPTYAQLSLIAWLMEAPDKRILKQPKSTRNSLMDFGFRELRPGSNDSGYLFAQVSETTYPMFKHEIAGPVGFQTFLDGNLKPRINTVVANGLIEQLTGYELHEKDGTSPLKAMIAPHIHRYHLSDTFYGMTPGGCRWWNESGKSLYVEAVRGRFSPMLTGEGTVLIGTSYRVVPEIPEEQQKLTEEYTEKAGLIQATSITTASMIRPTHTATVVKEIDTGYFIKDIVSLRDRLVGDKTYFAHSPIFIRSRLTFVEKAAVLAKDVADASVSKIIDTDTAIYHDLQESLTNAANELFPILKRHLDRARQQNLAHKEAMSAALAIANGSAGHDPADQKGPQYPRR